VADLSGGHRVTSLDEDLAAWGKVVILETRGRRSGRARHATVGFVTTDDGSILVAAADDDVHWARNLAADPRCVVERDGERHACIAMPLGDGERQAAVAALIMRYGTPAERLGGGPAFRLTSTGSQAAPTGPTASADTGARGHAPSRGSALPLGDTGQPRHTEPANDPASHTS
jgi:deazaflavin-dependent oxidoreductase (nitroreductase family)